METSTSDDRLNDRSDTKPTPAGFIIHERSERRLLTRIIHGVLKPLKPRLTKPKKLSDGATRLTATKRAQRYCEVSEQQIDGVWIYDLKRRESDEKHDLPKDTYRRRIIYFAGGGWQMPPSEHHWGFCAELVRRLGDTRVTIVSCPLAPKNPASVAFPQIERVYKKLLVDSTRAKETVIVAGDSSGGNIALCVVAWSLKSHDDESSKPPVAILVMSPTTDLRHELEAITEADKLDPIHTHQSIRETAKAWCPESMSPGTGDHGTSQRQDLANQGEWGFEDPRVSPIKADLSYLVQHGIIVYGVSGTYDVLEPEAAIFRDLCKEQGVTGEWLSWDGQMHCFPLTFRYGLKESKEAMDWIVKVLEIH